MTSQAAPDLYPDWSPDASKLVFFTEGGGLTSAREVWRVGPTAPISSG